MASLCNKMYTIPKLFQLLCTHWPVVTIVYIFTTIVIIVHILATHCKYCVHFGQLLLLMCTCWPDIATMVDILVVFLTIVHTWGQLIQLCVHSGQLL